MPFESDLIDPRETVFPPIRIVTLKVAFFGNDFTIGAIAWPVSAETEGAFEEVAAGFETVVFLATAADCPDN